MLNLDWTDTPAAGEYATGEGDGFRKGLNPSYALFSIRRQWRPAAKS
jgi:hypothetical protein